ncbi:MAG: 3-isopropylmalate dehydrogenase [Deltaproteobacteria bacterium]|nr:3-isopropylmalate dehydrogenase [Deltaproteobacteria bacterium]
MDASTVTRVALIGGDGIGPEVTEEAVKAMSAACGGDAFRFDRLPYCADFYLETGKSLPEGELLRFKRDYDAIFLGALGDPRVPDMRHARDILLGARMKLDLYINKRPVRLLKEELCPLKGRRRGDIDIVLYRENTEGAYAGIGGTLHEGTDDEIAVTEMVATRRGVERIVRAAFEDARSNGRGRVCMASKYNAIPHAHGLWSRVFRAVATEYPEITSTERFADVVAMELVRDPTQFGVIVTSNLLGDILSDLAAQVVGGIGLAPSANVHPGKVSLFEPVHGSAPDITGKGIANPLAAILTGAMLLRHVGRQADAKRIDAAVDAVIASGQTTPDLGGTLTTSAVGDAVCSYL